MRFIEIDGKKYEVTECLGCPCMAVGEGGWGTRCRHPEAFSDKEDYFGEEVPDWCPLREVVV